MLRLQRLAGNQAVGTLLTGHGGATVHRCGPVPCTCPAEEQAADSTFHRQAGQPSVNTSTTRRAAGLSAPWGLA